MYDYIVVYRGPYGRFKKERVCGCQDFFNAVYDIAMRLNISITELVSVSIGTNPELS